MIDQCLLPDLHRTIAINSVDEMVDAIQRLAVRGAPAIGVAGAYGMCLAMSGIASPTEARRAFHDALPRLREARPTAVNLKRMVDRMAHVEASAGLANCDADTLRRTLLETARSIEEEDRLLCDKMGKAGAHLLEDGQTVLTHCNAGALATAGSGTALAVIYEAHARQRRFRVIADETRPLLQGARLTAWELQQAGIEVTVICDNAAGHFFARGEIDLVITGADRIAANGDAANKIGTYTIATLARAHNVPFFIAAPSTTFDFEVASGDQIPIEERSEEEVWQASSENRPPAQIAYRNPAFDVTPAALISGWITESGILQPPFTHLRG